jgi:hypothetical protein
MQALYTRKDGKSGKSITITQGGRVRALPLVPFASERAIRNYDPTQAAAQVRLEGQTLPGCTDVRLESLTYKSRRLGQRV